MDFIASNQGLYSGEIKYTLKRKEEPLRPVEPLRKRILTDREKETLAHLAAGYTAEEIASRLYISIQTVISHRKNIIRKLGVSNVTAAVAQGLRNKLID